ncbi:DUF551 domain-containing protein [Cronobacter malonaticus]|uniref:DUF551 domain-containing protein n=1 Tax=Cronobacter malonaticus TaxID=413503 RepID=UPI0024AFC6C3|nr:DUF551 domain-containing protein [Cronobacter malonaticus]MDI7687770.1 DUF551 domain-containing protein [Cronobacter malonaticus]MDK1298976.1 DUF551 domain-containing protein [Cronobacter malonaticus]
MSTISNELVKDLRMAFSVWQQDYDPVEDKEQYDMFGLGVVAMDELLALRKERERAEPVYYGPYTPVMMGAGVWVSIADELPPHLEGREVWVTTAPPAPVVGDDSLPFDPQIAEYEQMMEAELKAAARTAYKVKSELSQMAEQLVRDTTALAVTLSAETDTTSQQSESLSGKAVSGWIPCSERMPPEKTGVLVATEFDGPGDWRMKWGTRVPGHPDAKNGWFIPGASWVPSHWQPLPEPPCK